jgi:hypothetical protein
MNPSPRCWSCNYPLHAIPSTYCPECGRAFDVADPRSTNPGRPIGRLARRLLAPPGVAALALLALATGAIVYGTGRPGDVDAWRRDPLILSTFDRARATFEIAATPWRVFALGFAAAAGLAAWLALRLVLFGVLRLRHARPPKDVAGRWRLRLALTALLVAVAAVWTFAGAERRWGAVWVRLKPVQVPAVLGTPLPPPAPPLQLTPEDEARVLSVTLRHGEPNERRTALKYLVERQPARAHDILERAASPEPEGDLTATILQERALYRDPQAAARCEKFLDDPRPAVRAAAIDLLGILHAPAYPIPLNESAFGSNPAQVASDPTIEVSGLFSLGDSHWDNRRYVRDLMSVPISPPASTASARS